MARIIYNGVEYEAEGEDYFWLDAIASLYRKLPQGVLIKSCVTCKHGSFSPFGNCPNEVFCVKDIRPKSKRDVMLLDKECECEKRSRKYFSYCDDFSLQTDDYYTYNDLADFLRK